MSSDRIRVATLAIALAASPAIADGTRDPDRPVFFRAPDARTAGAIRDAIHFFGSPSPNIREKARDDLFDIGWWTVERLADTVREGGQGHRSNAILVLGRLGDPRALGPLREAVRSDAAGEWPPTLAALMLGRMRDADDRTLASFREALKSKEIDKRRIGIALALARFARRKGPESAALLEEILDAPAPTPAVHHAALFALGFFRDRVAEPTADGTGLVPRKRFLDALGSSREDVRLSAALALAISRLDVVEDVCRDLLQSDGNPEVKRAALMVLGKPRERPDPKVTDLLVQVLEGTRPSREERDAAAYLLGLHRDPRSLDALKAVAGSNRSSDLAAAAVVAIGGIEDPGVPDLLIGKLGHPTPAVCAAAAAAATRLRNPEALQRVRAALARRIQQGVSDSGARADLRLAVEEIGRILKDLEDARAGRPVADRSPPAWSSEDLRRLDRTYRQSLLDLANLRAAQVLNIAWMADYRPPGGPSLPDGGGGPFDGGSVGPREVRLSEPYDLAVEFGHRPLYTAEDDPDEARPPVPR